MKRIVAVLLGVLLTATTVRAEHKLLITDVLEAKQIEVEAGYQYTKVNGKLNGLSTNSTTSSSPFSLGVGLGYGLEVEAASAYLYNGRQQLQILPGVTATVKRDGFADL